MAGSIKWEDCGQGSPGQKRAGDVSPGECEALSSNPRITKKTLPVQFGTKGWRSQDKLQKLSTLNVVGIV